MDPRIQTLIEGVRKAHVPMLWFDKTVFPTIEPACGGCIGGLNDPVIMYAECPVLAVAKELEDDEE